LKKPWHRHFETIGSISAIIVGVAALAISWIEAQNARELRLASSMPVLEAGLSTNTSDDIEFLMTVRNTGTGTAFIHQAELIVDGEALALREEIQRNLLGPDLPISEATTSYNRLELRALAASDDFRPLTMSWPLDEAYFPGIERLFSRLTAGEAGLTVCYCDVYERCWRTRVSDFPVPVESCPAPSGVILNLLRTSEGPS